MRQPHGHHHNTPKHHDDRDEYAGSETLQQHVGQRFGEGVGDEEDGETGVVLAGGDVEAFLQAVEFGIADVGAVEEGDEIEEAEPWDQTEVEFPEEPAVLGSLSDPCIPEQCADVIFDRIQCAPSPPRSGQRPDLGEAVHGRGSRSRLPRRRPLSPYRRPGSERYRCRFALSTASLWQSVARLSEKGSDEGGTKGRDGRLR